MKNRKSHNPQTRSKSTRGSARSARGQGRRDEVRQDHGGPQLTCGGGQLIDALEEDGGTFAIHSQAGVVDVPAEQWLSFLNSFSRQHEGWLTSITVEQNGKQQTQVREAKLEGISSDHLTTRGEIYLSVSRGDGTHLIHRMSNPIEVVFRRDLAGAHEGIDITSADGTLTKVHFRIAARPETLDGVVDSEHPRTR